MKVIVFVLDYFNSMHLITKYQGRVDTKYYELQIWDECIIQITSLELSSQNYYKLHL